MAAIEQGAGYCHRETVALDHAALFDIRDKVALVTGGASGIGAHMTEVLVRAGARVYIASRKQEALDEMATAMAKLGTCRVLQADLSNEEGVLALARKMAQQEDHLGILVNNAGRAGAAPLGKFPWRSWTSVLDINLTAVFALTQALLPMIRAAASKNDPARIVNIGSMAGIRPLGSSAYSYGASKAAVHHLTRILANELASDHITVNALAPGPFASRMTSYITDDEDSYKQMAQAVPLGRFGSGEDIAGTLLWLTSRAGAYVTGAVIPLDGGMTAKP